MIKILCNQKSKKNVLAAFLILLIVFFAVIVWGNLTVGTTYYKISLKRLPTEFNGYKIAQISDLHSAQFGKNNSKIISILKKKVLILLLLQAIWRTAEIRI